MIRVFHTSLQQVPEPDTKHSRSALDFGTYIKSTRL